jgi:hypothetical protein
MLKTEDIRNKYGRFHLLIDEGSRVRQAEVVAWCRTF